MPKSPYRQRLLPYKVLVILLYGEYPWLEREPGFDTTVKLSLRRCSQHLRISTTRLKEALVWLQEHQFLNWLITRRSEARLQMVNPSPAGNPIIDTYQQQAR